MRAVVQRVSSSSVKVEGKIVGQIDRGLAVLLGVLEGDTRTEAELLAKKLCELRIFTDSQGKMNQSVQDIGGGLLIVSQFTLAADCSHGRRPSFLRAANPLEASELYEYFISCVRDMVEGPVQSGIFGAHMEYRIINDGPVTILLDTDEWRKKA